MIARIGLVIVLVLLSTAVIECATAPKAARPEAAWINNMHRLSTAYLELTPIAGDARAFSSPQNREMIERNLNELVQGSAETVHDPKAPNVDPIIAFTAGRFAIEMRQASSAFKVGDQQWARYAVARAGDYCISCHTRADRGTKDFSLPWQPDLAALNGIQRVEFYLANRQYSTASIEAKKLAMDEKFANQDPRAWQVALEKVMAMTVRVQKDPQAASQLAELIIENSGAPNYLRRDALAWRREIQLWEFRKVKNQTGKEKFQTAVLLLDNAQMPIFDKPHTALVVNLRASALLHELLEDKKSPLYGESLFYAGLAEEGLRPINVFGLSQTYFESCIRQVPHSELGERCYGHLESSVRASNPFLGLDPEADGPVSLYLADMRRLSEVPNDPGLKGPFKFRELDHLDSNPKLDR